MNSSFASPFLRPAEGTVSSSPWLLTDEKGAEPLTDPIPEWDYSVDLSLSRTVRLDTARFLTDCHLAVGSRIAIVVHMKTGDAGIRRLVHREEIDLASGKGNHEFLLKSLFTGSEMQGSLELVTRIVLAEGIPKSSLAPSEPGSLLWEDVRQFKLEGGGGRLPMEAADFREIRPEYARAPWYLDVETKDLDASFIAACRIVLNLNRDDIISAVKKKSSTVLALLSSDLVRHVASMVIEMEELGDNLHQYDDGTVGATVISWMRTAFPDKSLDEVRAIKRGDPAKFEAILASVFGGNHGGD